MSDYVRVPTTLYLIDRGGWVETKKGPAFVDRVRRQFDDDGVLQIALGVVYVDSSTEWLVSPGGTDVTLLVPQGQLAVDTVLRTLGGTVVVREVEHMDTRNTAGARRAMRAHLLNVHRVWPGTEGESKDIAILLEAHARAHASPEPGALPHVHTELRR